MKRLFFHRTLFFVILLSVYLLYSNYCVAQSICFEKKECSNPAYLSSTKQNEITFKKSDLFGLGDSINSVTLKRIRGKTGFLFSFSNFLVQDYDYQENNYLLGIGTKVTNQLSIGTFINANRVLSLEEASGNSFSLGIYYQRDNIGSGLVYDNIGSTKWSTGKIDAFKPQVSCDLKVITKESIEWTFRISTENPNQLKAKLKWEPIYGVGIEFGNLKDIFDANVIIKAKNIILKYSASYTELGMDKGISLGYQF